MATLLDGADGGALTVCAPDPDRPVCPVCGAESDLTQPDPMEPDLLIGLCSECGATAAHYPGPDGPAALLIPLVRSIWDTPVRALESA